MSRRKGGDNGAQYEYSGQEIGSIDNLDLY